jgi:hypothetical protein
MKSLDNANSTELPTGEDEASMRASVARVHTIVEAQISRGIAPERIVLGGFSQGCVTTLLALISSPRQLQGMFCESGWLALSEHLEQRNGKIVHMVSLVLVGCRRAGVPDVLPCHSYKTQSSSLCRSFGAMATRIQLCRKLSFEVKACTSSSSLTARLSFRRPSWVQQSQEILREMGYNDIDSHEYKGEWELAEIGRGS